MNKIFKLQQLGTNVKTELTAGATTFFTMIYIIVVNPAILSSAGIPFEQVFYATILSIVIGTLLMAFWANLPIVIAPAMGLNAYFVNIAMVEEVSYLTVFGALFLAVVLFLLLSLTHYRQILIDAIPDTLKFSITAGIGLFIAFLGLSMSGIVVASEDTLVTLGNVREPNTLLTIVGLLITIILIVRKDKGAIFIGMLITGIIGYLTDLFEIEQVVSVPETVELVSFDITGVFSNSLFIVIITFLLISMIDTTGTMSLLNDSTGVVRDERHKKINATSIADSLASLVGALFGSTPATNYVESQAGMRVGGKTGLTALVVVVLSLLMIFLHPLVEAVSALTAITAPAIIIVGSYMFLAVTKIRWYEFEEAFLAFLVIVTIPLTANIATGMMIGFIIYPLIQLAKGNRKNVHPIMYIFAVVFILYMIFA